MKYTCKQCGKEFELTKSEIDFYKSKNLSLPKRCKECREQNKLKREADNVPLQPVNEVSVLNKSKPNFTKYTLGAVLIIALIIALIIIIKPQNDGIDNSFNTAQTQEVYFRNSELLNEHYDKHGVDMGFSSAQAYEKAAGEVVNNGKALHKHEAEDGDDVYYLEDTNELVIVSQDGYIRTYFSPDDGISYYNRQ